MHDNDATRLTPKASDSILIQLARRAMAPGVSLDQASWPRLDFADPAQRAFGDYELLDEIGRGGMGVVYRARQISLEREVAIKFIAAGLADTLNVARFLAEARVAARMMHPNIVPVHEVGSIGGVHYFSMPLIKGRSLADVLADGTLRQDVAISLLLKLCDAIDYAHRLGLLHLDIKPANVLFDERNEPLIADFGLARRMDERGGADAQEVSGTPSYMAPEQILIKQYRLTPATDIYALGAILYRVLAGVSPHGEGKADDVIRRVAAGRIQSPRELQPSIPRDLDAICMKCLELQPADRYPNVAALTDDLRRLRDGQAVSVRRVGSIERLLRWFRREPKLALSTVTALLALTLGIATSTWQWHEAVTQRDVARFAQAEAATARDHAQIASEIGAHLFAYEGDETKRADDLLLWLRQRLPNDDERQAEALSTFASTVTTANDASTPALLASIVETLGQRYRQQVIDALLNRNGSENLLAAALLTYQFGEKGSWEKQFDSRLSTALSANQDDPLAWFVAAVFCEEDVCSYPEAAEQLTRLDHDNMYPWLLRVMQEQDDTKWPALLHQAAQRNAFDDYFGRGHAAYVRAFEAASVPVPALLRRPLEMLSPGQKPEWTIGEMSANNMPISGWQRLIEQCGVRNPSATNIPAQVRADCLTVATVMQRSHGTLVAQMIGVVIVRELAKGTALADEAQEARRRYLFVSSKLKTLSRTQRIAYPADQWLADLQSEGELIAWQHVLRYFDIADEPPANWQPEDPIALLSSYERQDQRLALDRDARQALAAKDYRSVLELLDSTDDFKHISAGSAWLQSRYLTTLGLAQIGLSHWSAAQRTLGKACDLTDGLPPGALETHYCTKAQVALYSAWIAVEASPDHERRQRDWRSRLKRINAAPTAAL